MIYDQFVAPAVSDDALRREAAREAYRRSAGEVEARNVQARRNMTAPERRQTPPRASEDVPRGW